MSKIKYHGCYGYVNPTLYPLLKAVEAYNWEPVPEGFSSSTIYDFEGITTAEEEYIYIRDFHHFELKSKDNCT